MTMYTYGWRAAVSLVAALGLSSLACSDTLTVCSSGCGYTSIQAAINDASHGDVIEISADTYRPATRIDLRGRRVTLRGAVDALGNPTTIISGDTDNDGEGDIQVFVCQRGETNATIFENLVIRDGSAGWGGGLQLDGTSPLIRNCHFLDNGGPSAGWGQGGGAISAKNGAFPRIEACLFKGNGQAFGGAIYGSAQIRNSTFLENDASDSAAALYGGPFDVAYCRFEGNACGHGEASGISATAVEFRQSSQLSDCDFSGNLDTSNDPALVLGPLSFSMSHSVSNCRFEQNNGSGLLILAGAMVSDCTVSNNGGFGIIESDWVSEEYALKLSDSLVCGNAEGQVVLLSDDRGPEDWDFGGNCIASICDDDDGDGSPDIDSDGDGMIDCEDVCPWDPFNRDDDGDGIPDCMDQCTYYPAPYSCSDFGQTIYVPVGASIQNAIDMVPEYGTVRLLAGVHRLERTVEVYEKVVDLVGETGAVLSGDFDGDGIADVEILRLMDVFDRMNVRNLSFRHGRSSNVFGGGAVYVDDALVNFQECAFQRNEGNLGGAIYVYNSRDVDFTACVFTANQAITDGGAVYVQNSIDATFRTCTFIDNTAGNGGAIKVLDADAYVHACVLERNRATSGQGGGLAADLTGTFSVQDTYFCGNLPLPVDGPCTYLGGNLFGLIFGLPGECSENSEGGSDGQNGGGSSENDHDADDNASGNDSGGNDSADNGQDSSNGDLGGGGLPGRGGRGTRGSGGGSGGGGGSRGGNGERPERPARNG